MTQNTSAQPALPDFSLQGGDSCDACVWVAQNESLRLRTVRRKLPGLSGDKDRLDSESFSDAAGDGVEVSGSSYDWLSPSSRCGTESTSSGSCSIFRDSPKAPNDLSSEHCVASLGICCFSIHGVSTALAIWLPVNS